MRRVVAELAAAQPQPQGYQQFLLDSVAGRVCLQGLAASGLDPKDAAVNALLSDAASLLLQASAWAWSHACWSLCLHAWEPHEVAELLERAP